MAWFKRESKGLVSQQKKDMPDLWAKCPACDEIIYKPDLEKNFFVCAKCGYHFRATARAYLRFLLDEGSFEEFNANIVPVDVLKFKGIKKYSDQLKEAARKSGVFDAVITGYGRLAGQRLVLAVMDFSFIGGSMGSVVGEKIALAADESLYRRQPLIIICASGGARMMEGALSLMQMAKTSARLARLADARVPFVSILTHPTTGGVTASFAMLGDVIIAEPGALIGFAGPRVIKQTIGQDLPEGFQTAEFLLKHGFVDLICPRPALRDNLTKLLRVMVNESADETKDGAVRWAETNSKPAGLQTA